jgi:hypothetical protein
MSQMLYTKTGIPFNLLGLFYCLLKIYLVRCVVELGESER